VALFFVASKVIAEWKPQPMYNEVNKKRREFLKAASKLVAGSAKKSIRKKRGSSAEGDVPFGKTGNARKSIKYQLNVASAVVGLTLPTGAHGWMLEEGTSKMAARPIMGPALERETGGIRQLLRRM